MEFHDYDWRIFGRFPQRSAATRLPVVVSVDLQHSGFLDFCLTVPVDVVKVKSYANCLFHLARIEMGISINKLYFVQERAVTSVVGKL